MTATYEELIARAAPYLFMRALDNEQTGAMVALVPSEADAARLAVEGGEPAEQLHVTLMYLGEAAAIPPDARGRLVDRMRSLVEDIGATYGAPIVADGFAVSMFNPTGPDPCIVLGLGGAEIDAVHDLVVPTVAEAVGGLFDLPAQHRPWVAHMTLEYTGDPARVEALLDRTGPVNLDRLRVAFADDVVDISLGDAASEYGLVVMSPYPEVRERFVQYLNLPALPAHLRYSDDQDRDENGRFAGGGGGGSSAGKGKDLVGGKGKSNPGASELAASVAAERGQYSGRSKDEALSAIAARQGFDARPQVVSRDEMDGFISRGSPEMLRGVQPSGDKSADDINEEFRSGDAHYGTGVYGNGYYFAPPGGQGFAAAEAFSHGEGSLMRATLHPDAKVVSYRQVRQEQDKYFESRGYQPSKETSLIKDNTVPRDTEDLVYRDLGRFAAARGYDVIKMDYDKKGGYIPTQYLVLNRGAVIVEEAQPK